MNSSSSLDKTLILDAGRPRGETRRRFLDGLSADLNIAMASGSHLAVLLIDLQRFALINNLIGYDAADEVLIHVQKKLAASISKASLVARLGDNLFGLVIPELKSPVLIQLAIEKIRVVLKEVVVFNGEEINLDCHVGLALHPGNVFDSDGLLLEAEKNLLAAKIEPTKDFCLPDKKIQKKHERWQLEKHLKKALDANALEFYYQPKIDIKSNKPASVEALVRWHSKELGLVLPDEFIPIAEESAVINQITQWGIKTALREKKVFDQLGTLLSVAVNISSSDVYDKNLLATLDSALAIWGVEPEQLTLEVTEGVILNNAKLAIKNLQLIRDKGIKISIDDFGTGFSSLSYFKTLPADELKIDKSFIQNMTRNSDDAAIVELVITLAHKFNMRVVAEGVESASILNMLKSMGCDYAQGYYFSRPLPKDELVRWLKSFNDDENKSTKITRID